jgi:NADH:ubiquinone oxidoreductase subunit 5 (subunit L)/multisubunit Na+/H+ antiporter MnhA subunit
MAILGYGGALLHVLNHAVCKSLLFMGAGSVLHATGTRDSEQLGGLLKKMPQTGALFLAGLAALGALPPLNGFVGEFLIYLAAFMGLADANAFHALLGLAAIVGLGIVGALTLAAFTKLFGVVFLGEPRNAKLAESAHEAGLAMRLPMWTLALLCPALALASPWLLPCLIHAVQPASGVDAAVLDLELAKWTAEFRWPWLVMGAFALLLPGLALLRWLLLRRRHPAGRTVTWDCGYTAPTPRMQYTGSSFVQPLLAFFAPLVRIRQRLTPPQGLFPAPGKFETTTDDPVLRAGYGSLFRWGNRVFSWLHWVQHGHLTLYLLYMTLTLIILLLWFGVVA